MYQAQTISRVISTVPPYLVDLPGWQCGKPSLAGRFFCIWHRRLAPFWFRRL